MVKRVASLKCRISPRMSSVFGCPLNVKDHRAGVEGGFEAGFASVAGADASPCWSDAFISSQLQRGSSLKAMNFLRQCGHLLAR